MLRALPTPLWERHVAERTETAAVHGRYTARPSMLLTLTQSTEAHPTQTDVTDWRNDSWEAWRSARRLSYPASSVALGAFLIGKSDYFISRQTAGSVWCNCDGDRVGNIDSSRRRSLFGLRLNVLIIIARRERYWARWSRRTVATHRGARVF